MARQQIISCRPVQHTFFCNVFQDFSKFAIIKTPVDLVRPTRTPVNEKVDFLGKSRVCFFEDLASCPTHVQQFWCKAKSWPSMGKTRKYFFPKTKLNYLWFGRYFRRIVFHFMWSSRRICRKRLHPPLWVKWWVSLVKRNSQHHNHSRGHTIVYGLIIDLGGLY